MLKDILAQKESNQGKGSAIYCLGFSQYHDADLLNKMAQIGSTMGNFIYIDTQADYKKQLADSFGQCLSMAIESSSKNKLKISSKVDNKYSKNLLLKHRYVFEEKQPIDEKAEDMQIDTELQTDWSSIVYECKTMFDRQQIESGQLVFTIQLEEGIVQQCVVELELIEDPPFEAKSAANLEFLNKKIFALIQQIQKATTREERAQALGFLMALDKAMDNKYDEFMKIKDRKAKKELIQQLQDCK